MSTTGIKGETRIYTDNLNGSSGQVTVSTVGHQVLLSQTYYDLGGDRHTEVIKFDRQADALRLAQALIAVIADLTEGDDDYLAVIRERWT